MPLSPRIARFNRRVTNPIARLAAGRVPPLAIVVHMGRRSGRTYRTPVMAFRGRGGGYLIALTYGPDTDWVRNVVTAQGCDLVRRGKTLRLTDPRLTEMLDPPDDLAPPVRGILRRLQVTMYLQLLEHGELEFSRGTEAFA